MPITLEQAKALKYGDTVHEDNAFNKDGSNKRWRVSGKVQIWKRAPGRIKIPVKHGLYGHGYITEDNIDKVSLGGGS